RAVLPLDLFRPGAVVEVHALGAVALAGLVLHLAPELSLPKSLLRPVELVALVHRRALRLAVRVEARRLALAHAVRPRRQLTHLPVRVPARLHVRPALARAQRVAAGALPALLAPHLRLLPVVVPALHE